MRSQKLRELGALNMQKHNCWILKYNYENCLLWRTLVEVLINSTQQSTNRLRLSRAPVMFLAEVSQRLEKWDHRSLTSFRSLSLLYLFPFPIPFSLLSPSFSTATRELHQLGRREALVSREKWAQIWWESGIRKKRKNIEDRIEHHQ